MYTLFMKYIKTSIWIGLSLIILTGGLVQCQNFKSVQPTEIIYPQNGDKFDEEDGFGEDEEGDEDEEDAADEEDR